MYFLRELEEEEYNNLYDNCHIESCGNPECKGHPALETRKGEVVALVANRSCEGFNEMIED